MRVTCAAGWFALALSMAAAPRPLKPAAIDELCKTIRNEFLEAAPRLFSGPDPWLELDRPPASFADVAVASVYHEGAQIRWVVLQMQGPGNAWFETTHYFFTENGIIEKRERHLEHFDSHVAVDEDLYFSDRKVIKTSYRHARLNGERENWETFYDPDAPLYTATVDLPDLFLRMDFSQLAGNGGWLHH